MKERFENRQIELASNRVRGFREYAPTFHMHAELVLVEQGHLCMSVDGETRTLGKGEIGMVFPYCLHSYEKSEDAQVTFLLFSPFAAGELGEQLLSKKPRSAYLADESGLSHIFERVHSFACDTEDEARMRVAKSYLSALVGELLLTVDTVRRDAYDASATQRILAYCAEHFREPLSVGALSEALFVSESTVTKVIASRTGGGFRTYLNALRVGEAKRLLCDGRRKIVDVMLECGFSNQSSFNRIFWKHVGMTPREWREQRTET